MSYAVKEIFKTLQGEGAHAGRPAVFCRFAGCNLACAFCDTDFTGTDGTDGGRYETAGDLVATIERVWQGPTDNRFVVLTGGEPLLQADAALIDLLHDRQFEVAVETNGTLAPPAGIDWLCVSPKARELAVRQGDELKLVYPQADLPPEAFILASAASRCSRWMGRSWPKIPRAPSPIASPIRNGSSACKPTSISGSADVRSSSPPTPSRCASFLTNREAAMSQAHTVFGSLRDYTKGTIELVTGEARHYVFSNIFEVASRSKPYERVVVGKNMEYVQEVMRAEGVSPWFACGHDEFALCMDGEVTVEFIKLKNPPTADKNGAVLAGESPEGTRMGHVKLRRGHQVLLGAGNAYRFTAATTGVLLQQTVLGDLSVQKWREICLT